MRNNFLNLIILSVCISCGAAKNNSRNDSGKKPSTPRQSGLNTADQDFQKNLRSQIYRNRKSPQYSYLQIQENIIAKKLPRTHREVPDIEQDRFSKVLGPTKLPAIDTSCGNENTIINIGTRHSSCKNTQVDINSVTWSGKENGISGEGNWRMIVNSTFTENNSKLSKQVWQDLTTGLLWSDELSEFTWMEASGVENFADSRPCMAISDNPVHALGRIHPDVVQWRLPNRNEFLQADLNGSRFVLPILHKGSQDEAYLWTASLEDESHAWAIKLSTGELVLKSIDDRLKVRCIGVALK